MTSLAITNQILSLQCWGPQAGFALTLLVCDMWVDNILRTVPTWFNPDNCLPPWQTYNTWRRISRIRCRITCKFKHKYCGTLVQHLHQYVEFFYSLTVFKFAWFLSHWSRQEFELTGCSFAHIRSLLRLDRRGFSLYMISMILELFSQCSWAGVSYYG